MLGFAVVEVQDALAAVWLVSRTELHRADSTNAVVLAREDTEKLASLTADRLVLAETGVSPVAPHLDLGKVNELLHLTFELQDEIHQRWPALRLPDEPIDRSLEDPLVEHLLGPLPADLPFRALAVADCLRKAWTFWLATEQVRHRKANQLHAVGKGGDPAEPIWSSALAALPSDFLPATRESVAADA